MASDKKRITAKNERDKQMYLDYCELITNEPNALFMSRWYFYQKLSEKYFIDERTVCRIINDQVKHAK